MTAFQYSVGSTAGASVPATGASMRSLYIEPKRPYQRQWCVQRMSDKAAPQ